MTVINGNVVRGRARDPHAKSAGLMMSTSHSATVLFGLALTLCGHKRRAPPNSSGPRAAAQQTGSALALPGRVASHRPPSVMGRHGGLVAAALVLLALAQPARAGCPGERCGRCSQVAMKRGLQVVVVVAGGEAPRFPGRLLCRAVPPPLSRCPRAACRCPPIVTVPNSMCLPSVHCAVIMPPCRSEVRRGRDDHRAGLHQL